MTKCEACGAALETPVACAACGALREVPDGASPFELLGLEPAIVVDERTLRGQLTRFARLVHPDFFAAAEPVLRERAGRNSARLNHAFEVLADSARRADWLVTALGGPAEDTERAMPQAFLAEVLEWNEVLEEARAEPEPDPRVARLAVELAARRASSLERIARALEPLPEHGSPALATVRRELNAVRYLDRALGEIESLRLARSERR
ncbi:MAG: hypothetical protein JNK02_05060 [Planctomycetes bacterium]|nr:hypothetical protein [Planctomycetota bacterium]